MSKEWLPAPYMEAAMQWVLQRDGCGLMLDPGMRKTSITLACVDILRHVGEIRKTLVIAPLRVCKTVWRQEGAKWRNFNHLKIVNLCGMTVVLKAKLLAEDHHVYLINPEMVQDRTDKLGNTVPGILSLIGKDFDMLVIDESTKFKDTQTKRFKALRAKLHNFKRRVILTGTPVPNGLQDLFGQMFVVDLGAALGKYVTHFRMEFCYQRPGDIHNWHLRAGSDDMIYKRVANRLMRLDIKDHIDMPDLTDNFITVSLPANVRETYKAMEKDFIIQLDTNPIVAANPAVAGGKLRQIANGFLYEGENPRKTHRLHDEKLEALTELVEEMQGRPLLVAYEFEADQEAIMERFDGTKGLPAAIDLGRCKNPERVVEQFNRGEIPLLIAHPASAGHGLNLQDACNTLCWYGITWNLEYYDQFNARVYRSGQGSSQVMVHHIVCEGTKDEDVMSALEGKDRTQKSFNQAIKRPRV